MKFTRHTAGYNSLNRRRNGNISEKINIDSVKKKLAQCKEKWLNHVSRMEDISTQNNLTINLVDYEDLDDH
jgi:hypothetical protein